jgi:site-specific DNA-methyltransferase (adenine-specific)
MKPTYRSDCGRVELYHADALDVLPHIAAGSVDAMVTDPPYSSGGFTRSDKNATPETKYTQSGQRDQWATFSGDNRDALAFAYWCDLWMRLAVNTLRRGGYALTFTDWRQLPTVANIVQAAGLVWRGIVAWDKSEGSRAPHKGYFRHQCEYVVWSTLGPCLKAEHDGPYPGCLRHSIKHSEKRHMTGKPSALMSDLLRICKPGETVLDPFGGSGMTGVAAVRRGLRFIGIERDPHYFEVMHELVTKELAATEAA